jgi:hypothetical protein
MKRTFVACLLSLAAALAACDGGSRGSGITTAQGDLQSVQSALRVPARETTLARLARSWLRSPLASRAEADSGVSGVRVSIEGTSFSDVTDDTGSFRLRGDFGGDAVIRFEPPGGGVARFAVNAPAGGTLTLEQVRVDSAAGTATPARQTVVFDGLVVSTDCAASRIDLVSRDGGPTDTDIYVVTLEGSTLRDAEGMTLTCSALLPGDPLDVHAVVQPDGTFGDAELIRR